jgi:hypothetical protein
MSLWDGYRPLHLQLNLIPVRGAPATAGTEPKLKFCMQCSVDNRHLLQCCGHAQTLTAHIEIAIKSQ